MNWLIGISTLDRVLGTGSKRRRQNLAILIREGDKTQMAGDDSAYKENQNRVRVGG